MSVSVSVNVTAEDLVNGCLRSELTQLVKDVDLVMADWDFTLDLYEHFAKLKAEYDVETRKESGT